MADDRDARIAQLEAELQQAREHHAAEVATLHAEHAALAEQQAATAEILKLIAASPRDLTRALSAICEAAAPLCDAEHVALMQVRERDGQLATRAVFGRLVEATHERYGPDLFATMPGNPITSRATVGRAFIERRTIHIEDLADPAVLDAYPEARPGQERWGQRTVLSVPLLRSGESIGVLYLVRFQKRPFTEWQIALVEAFADQAVIAIENARLFQELEQRNAELQESNRQVIEALEQQTATAEVLRVIAASPTDVQPVIDTIVASAKRLTDANGASLWRVDGSVLRGAAAANLGPSPHEEFQRLTGSERPIDSSNPTGRAALERRTIRVADMAAEPDLPPAARATQQRLGLRSQVVVPLLREDEAIGVLVVNRHQVRPFSDKHVALLETFADQAIIAIENARLFKELEQRNEELSKALEQQTATAEILRVIASSPHDLRTVLDAIAQSAARLISATTASVWRLDGDVVRLSGRWSSLVAPLTDEQMRAHTRPLDRNIGVARVILDRRTSHVADVQEALDRGAIVHPGTRELIEAAGYRSAAIAPLMLGDAAIGTISVMRSEVQPFSDDDVALLESFADQAVIAIENARLFEELERRNAELQESNRQVSEALEQQTATAEVLRVIASSPTDLDTVLQAILDAAGDLCDAEHGFVFQRSQDDHRLAGRAFRGVFRDFETVVGLSVAAYRSTASISGRAYVERRAIAVDDLANQDEYPRARDNQRRLGGAYRSQVSVPLLRRGEPVGILSLARTEVRSFTNQEIAAGRGAAPARRDRRPGTPPWRRCRRSCRAGAGR